MSTRGPAISPEPILRHAYGFWASAILAAGIKHEVFRHLDAGARTAVDVAAAAGIAERGAQALLDGLLGMGLVVGNDRDYRNSEASDAYLIPGKMDYLGGYADMILSTFDDWKALPAVAATGRPLHNHENANPDNPFWEPLVTALAPLGFAPARAAADRLAIDGREDLRMLDVAGGAGPWSVIWLDRNEACRCDQIDWPNVNRIARDYVDGFGNGSRFRTIDGDMEELDLGEATYDYVIYANIAHGLSEERNVAMFRKIRRALRPGGAMAICGLVPNDDRTGHPLLLMFTSNMVLNTEAGAIHTQSEYERWLAAAGFANVEFQAPEDVPLSLIYARR